MDHTPVPPSGLVWIEPLAAGGAIGLVAHHALGQQAGEGLVEGDVAALSQRPGEESGVQQMQNRVLDTADVLVHGQPVVDGGAGERRLGVGRAEAGEIPRRIDEGIAGVGLAKRRRRAGRTGDVLPARVVLQRIARLFEAYVVGERHWKLGPRHGDDSAGRAVDDRDRAAPISLPRDTPVAKPELDRRHPALVGLHALGDGVFGLGDAQPIEKPRMDQDAIADEGLVHNGKVRGGRLARRDHRNHPKSVLVRELQIALIVRGAPEHGAGAVLHQYEVGDVDRQFHVLAERVAGTQSGVQAALLGRLDGLLAGPHAIALGDEVGHGGLALAELAGQGMVG